MKRMGIASLVLAVAVAVSAGCGGGEQAAELAGKGKALVAEGKFDAAVETLKKATEADKNSLEAWLQLGHAYRGLKKYDDALAAYVAAKRIDRQAVAPHLAHAGVQVALGRFEQAVLEYTLVTEMDPKNVEALLALGRVSQQPHKQPDGTMGITKADLERAELNLEAAATIAPKDADIQRELAQVREKLGRK